MNDGLPPDDVDFIPLFFYRSNFSNISVFVVQFEFC